jgi:hypothetical protein
MAFTISPLKSMGSSLLMKSPSDYFFKLLALPNLAILHFPMLPQLLGLQVDIRLIHQLPSCQD